MSKYLSRKLKAKGAMKPHLRRRPGEQKPENLEPILNSVICRVEALERKIEEIGKDVPSGCKRHEEVLRRVRNWVEFQAGRSEAGKLFLDGEDRDG